MAAFLATGLTQAQSTDITLADGASAMVNLRTTSGLIPSDCVADIQVKDSAGVYMTIGRLDSVNPAQLIYGPATYRIDKKASSVTLAVDKS